MRHWSLILIPVLTGAIAPERFKAIAGRHAQILQDLGLIQQTQLAQSDRLYVGR